MGLDNRKNDQLPSSVELGFIRSKLAVLNYNAYRPNKLYRLALSLRDHDTELSDTLLANLEIYENQFLVFVSMMQITAGKNPIESR